MVDLAPICMKDGPLTDDDWEKVSTQLREGFSKYGYVYLINHGIPEKKVCPLCTHIYKKSLLTRIYALHFSLHPSHCLLSLNFK